VAHIGLVVGSLTAFVAVIILAFWGFRLGSTDGGGGDGPSGGCTEPRPQPQPPSGGSKLISGGIRSLDLRDFSAGKPLLESAAMPKRKDRQKVPAAMPLDPLTAK